MSLDSGPFAAFMLAFFSDGEGSHVDGAGMAFFQKHAAAVLAGMNAVPMRNGMPWSDPSLPYVGYGFADETVKTGNCFYSTVLYWIAANDLARLFTAVGDTKNAQDMQNRSAVIASSVTATFWNDTRGMFLADTGMEANITDVWGSALAVTCGLATASQTVRVSQFLLLRAPDVFLRGQVREMPMPELWNKLVTGPPPYTPGYQNGGYWATPLHHVLPTLALASRSTACGMLADCVKDFQTYGANEWVIGEGMRGQNGAPSYVASIANTLKASEKLRCWES